MNRRAFVALVVSASLLVAASLITAFVLYRPFPSLPIHQAFARPDAPAQPITPAAYRARALVPAKASSRRHPATPVRAGLPASLPRDGGGSSPPGPNADSTASLSLAFAGDIMAHVVNYTHRPYSAIYGHVSRAIREADLAFANLEFTVDPNLPYAGYPRFNVHPEYVEAAIAAGFRAFSVANNHINDYGAAGIEATYAALSSLRARNGIAFSGIHAAGTEHMQPVTIERKGFRIGFLAITEFLNGYVSSDGVNVVNYNNPSARALFLERLKKMTTSYDLFILSVHGGQEYSLKPDPVKEAFFNEAIRAGVTIVWSQHPHVLQPWVIETVDGARRLIISSNGNFVSGQTSQIDPLYPDLPRTYTGDSAIFRVTVERDAAGASVTAVQPLLISNFKDADGEMIVLPLKELASMPLSSVWHDYYRYRLAAILPITRGVVVEADGSREQAIGLPAEVRAPSPKAGLKPANLAAAAGAAKAVGASKGASQ